MTIRIDVYEPDLVTLIGSVALAKGISWVDEWDDVGAGTLTAITTDTSLTTGILDPENMVVVHDTDLAQDLFAWLMERYQRTRHDNHDEIAIAGPGLLDVLRRGLVYLRGGITGNPADVRIFAWTSPDYIRGAGWTSPTSFGTYDNPTDPSLGGDPGGAGQNEIQHVRLNAESPPYPWGSDYPSPGGLQGTWRLTFRGKTTGAIQWDASAAGVKSALDALSNIDSVTVTGVGTTADPYVVEFSGPNVQNKQHPIMGITHSDLRHTHLASGNYVIRAQTGRVEVEAEELVEGWPDRRSEWFGAFGIVQHHRRLIRVDLVPHKAGDAEIWVVSLAPVTVYFDGEEVGDAGKLDILRISTTFHDVPHVVAFRSTAPTMMTIVRVDDEGNPVEVLWRTFTPAIFGGPGDTEEWFVFGPDEPPGVTPGFIVKTLFDEAKARGVVPPITIDFDADVDSEGRTWSTDLEMGVQVGNDTVLSAAERLRDVGAYPRLGPDLVLHLYDGHVVDRTATVGAGIDEISELSSDADGELINALLIRNADSWVEFHQATGGPRLEDFLSLGTVPSVRAALTIGAEHVTDFVQVREIVQFTLNSPSVRPALRPYSSHGVGDLIIAPRALDFAAMFTPWFYASSLVSVISARILADGSTRFSYEAEAGSPASFPE